MRTTLKLIAIIACFALVFAGCGGGATEEVDLNAYTLDEIVEKAKAEGDVQSVGMPDYWANWGLSWEGLSAEYGITHTDADMSSAEELTAFETDPYKKYLPFVCKEVCCYFHFAIEAFTASYKPGILSKSLSVNFTASS